MVFVETACLCNVLVLYSDVAVHRTPHGEGSKLRRRPRPCDDGVNRLSVCLLRAAVAVLNFMLLKRGGDVCG